MFKFIPRRHQVVNEEENQQIPIVNQTKFISGIERPVKKTGFRFIPRRDELTDGEESRPRYVGEKSLDEQILDDDAYIRDLQRQPIENRNSRGKSILKALGYGLQAFNRPIRDWNDFANAAGNTAAHGIGAAIDKKLDERLDNQREIEKTEKSKGFKFIQRRHQREDEKEVAQINKTNAETKWYGKRGEIEDEKAKDRRRRNLVSIFNRLPEFDPDDPTNADLVAEMKELDIPTPQKTRGSQFKIEQDPRSGNWFAIQVNKSTGEATSSPVTTQDGKPLVTESKQNFAQEWKSAENDEQRAMVLRKSAADRAARIAIAEKRIASSQNKGEYNDKQKMGMPRAKLPELMRRKGFQTEQEAIDWLSSQGITVF